MAVLKQGGAVKVGTEIALRDLVPS
jgi:hypothetical protein